MESRYHAIIQILKVGVLNIIGGDSANLGLIWRQKSDLWNNYHSVLSITLWLT